MLTNFSILSARLDRIRVNDVLLGKLIAVAGYHNYLFLALVEFAFVLLSLNYFFDKSRLCYFSRKIFDMGVHHIKKLALECFWFSCDKLAILLRDGLYLFGLRFHQPNIFSFFFDLRLYFLEVLSLQVSIKGICQIEIFLTNLTYWYLYFIFVLF